MSVVLPDYLGGGVSLVLKLFSGARWQVGSEVGW